MSTVNLLTVFKIILGVGSLLLASICLLLLVVDLARSRCKSILNSQNAFHFLIIVQAVVRSVLQFLPISVYISIFRLGAGGMVIQNLLDMLPECLFILIYCCILYSWAEIFHLSKSAHKLLKIATTTASAQQRKKSQRSMQRRPILALLVTVIIMIVVLSIQSLLVGLGWQSVFAKTYYNLTISQAVWLALFALIATVGFFIYTCLLAAMMRKMAKFSQRGFLKRSLVKCAVLGVIFVVSLLIRLLYMLWLQGSLQRNLKNDDVRNTLWFLYFIITEHIPLLLVIIVTRTFATAESVSGKLNQLAEKKAQKRLDGERSRKRRRKIVSQNGLPNIVEPADDEASDKEEGEDLMTAEEAAFEEASQIVSSFVFDAPQVEQLTNDVVEAENTAHDVSLSRSSSMDDADDDMQGLLQRHRSQALSQLDDEIYAELEDM